LDEAAIEGFNRNTPISLAGNVGVVSGIFSSKNDRHADMSAQCRRHNTDHVGDIALCRLVGRHVGVMSARVNCDVSAPCRRFAARAEDMLRRRILCVMRANKHYLYIIVRANKLYLIIG
jgi:hypothetical protein